MLELLALGVGSGSSTELLPSSFVLCQNAKPLLLIDCGPGVLNAFEQQFHQWPEAVFISHLHFDHIGDLERLFAICALQQHHCKLYVPANLVAKLVAKIDNHPAQLAEGRVNLFEALQLVPIGSGFWLNDLNFNAFAVRHHLPQSCFGLHLPGSFVFSADTRPIPDLLEQLELVNEVILHDVGLVGNPSHSGLEDILANYSRSQREQLWAYHYRSHQDAERLRHAGLRVLKPGQRLSLPAPHSLAEQLGWQLNDLPYLSLPHSQ